jgi:hypothetical protein
MTARPLVAGCPGTSSKRPRVLDFGEEMERRRMRKQQLDTMDATELNALAQKLLKKERDKAVR